MRSWTHSAVARVRASVAALVMLDRLVFHLSSFAASVRVILHPSTPLYATGRAMAAVSLSYMTLPYPRLT